MSVWIRRSAIALGVVMLVLAVGVGWLAARFDPADHKGLAIEWVKARYDRTLTIDGPIRLSVFPRLRIELTDVSLSESGRPDSFASLAEASLAVELLPLLRSRLAVDRVEARGLRLVLLRDAKGRSNIDDLLKPPPGTATTLGGPALQFDVNRILLSDVRARVKDERAGVDGELVIKDLSSGRIASNVESGLSVVAQFGFMSPALKGELSGSTRFTPDLATGSVHLADMNLGYKGDAPGASSVDALLKGTLAWDGASASLSATGLNLRLTANTAGLRLVGSTLGVERFALDPSRRAFAINQLQLRIKGSQGGKPLALDLDWPELDVSGDALKGSALAGKLSYGSEAPLSVTFKSGAPSGNFDQVRVPAFEARVSSAATSRRLVGGLRSELVLQPGERSVRLDQIDLQLRLDEPELKPLALALKGSATTTVGNARWNLNGEVNANRFDTEGTATFAGITPTVKTQFRFSALDMNTLLEPVAAGARGGSDTSPISLDGLRSLNGSVGLRIGSLALRQYRATDVGLDATLDAGMLRVSRLRGRAWDGTFEGSAFADARASRMAVKVSADGMNLQALLKDLGDTDLLEGRGRIDVDIESAGRTLAELKSRLKGNAQVQVSDGAIKGVNLARSLRQAKAALALRQDALIKASKTEKTDFSELTASFRIDAGVARTTDVALKSPLLRLEGAGSVDIVKNRLDSAVRALVTDAAKGQEGLEMAALKGLAVPVQLSGPLEALNWQIQWSAVATGALGSTVGSAVKAEAETRLKDRLRPRPEPRATAPAASGPSAEEQLKGRLKGLLP